jgi:hypothetical protein
MLYPELILVVFWIVVYALTGAFIAMSDPRPAHNDVVLWSGSYGAAGAWLCGALLLVSTSH